MNNRSPETLTGIFVIIALILSVGIVALLGSGTLTGSKNRYVLFFENSVKGLSVGSSVVLGGVPVGQVRDIRIRAGFGTRPVSIPVVIEIYPDRIQLPEGDQMWEELQEDLSSLIDMGLRGQLEQQSMVTGQLLVALDFHPGTHARLQGGETDFPQIPTIPSDLEQLAKTIRETPIQEIFIRLNSIIADIETKINSPRVDELVQAVTRTLNNVSDLSENAEQIMPAISSDFNSVVTDIRQMIQAAHTAIATLEGRIEFTAGSIDTLIQSADIQVQRIGDRLDGTIIQTNDTVKDIRKEVGRASDSLKQATAAFERMADASGQAFGTVGDTLHPDSVLMSRMALALDDMSQAARALRDLARYLERNPDALIRGK